MAFIATVLGWGTFIAAVLFAFWTVAQLFKSESN